MATPVVSGCLAILLSKDNDLSPQQLKSQIINSCTSLNEKSDNQGAGIVNLSKLFKQTKIPNRRPNAIPNIRPNRRRLFHNDKNANRKEKIEKIEKIEHIEKQSHASGGLVILLFLILLLIRIL